MLIFRDKYYTYHGYLDIDLTAVFDKNLDIDKAINNLDVVKCELKKLKKHAAKLNLVLNITLSYEGYVRIYLAKKLGDKRDMQKIKKELNSKLLHMNYYKMFSRY